jgi:hypothetical protein
LHLDPAPSTDVRCIAEITANVRSCFGIAPDTVRIA